MALSALTSQIGQNNGIGNGNNLLLIFSVESSIIAFVSWVCVSVNAIHRNLLLSEMTPENVLLSEIGLIATSDIIHYSSKLYVSANFKHLKIKSLTKTKHLKTYTVC